MTRLSALACLGLLLVVSSGVAAMAQVNVYTRSYDTARTGANLQETILTPANVNPTSFGKLFTVKTDGEVFAQPLYVSGLAINGGTHNVVFVASMLNTVYAIDADNGTVLWSQNFGTPITPKDVENDQNISWSTGIGILGTPVIDPGTNIMYFVSGYQNGSSYAYRLNAIEIATGLTVSGSPTTITATYSTADLSSPLVFNPKMQNQRTGLALANGNVYFGFGSHEDQKPYHGWVMAYSESTLAQTAVYADTTLGSMGGIWNSGQAPVVDSSGNLYMSTGNGSFGTTPNNLVQTGNSMIKLSPSLELLDYFTPNNSATLNAGDMDLGSSGLLLVPNTSYLLGGGKQGVLYLVNTGGMGGFNSSSDQVHQEFQAIYGKGTSHIHGTPAYFDSDVNGPTTFVWGENDVLRGFVFNPTTGLLTTTPFATSTMTAPVTNNNGAMPGGFVSISANGTTNGIVWASTPYNGDANGQVLQGVLYAFNADTLSPLWSDKTNDARDEIGFFSKYCPPMVANGKVYVPNFGPLGTTNGSGSLVVYGLLPAQNNVLTVTANNAARAYDAANPAFSGTVKGAVNGDTFTESFTTAATTTSKVGSYPIVPSVTGANLSELHRQHRRRHVESDCCGYQHDLECAKQRELRRHRQADGNGEVKCRYAGRKRDLQERIHFTRRRRAERQRRGHAQHCRTPSGYRYCDRCLCCGGELCRQHLAGNQDHREGRNTDHHLPGHRQPALRKPPLYGKGQFQRRQQLSSHHYSRIRSGGHQRGQSHPHRRRHGGTQGRASRK